MGEPSELALHPWNESFEWVPHHQPLRRLTQEQADQFDREGFVVLDDVFSEDELAPVIEAIDRQEALVDAYLATLEDGRLSIAEHGAITFALFPAQTEQAARDFAAHRVFAELCSDLVGPNAVLYHDQAVYKKPAKPRRFPWHQDNGYNFVEPQQYLTCWVALTDATVDNGCPHVANGLNQMGTLAHTYNDPLGWEIFETAPMSTPAPVRAGGIVVFSSLSPHLTGPNTTDDVRKSYILQYAPVDAVVLQGDPTAGGPASRTPVTEEARRFRVLNDGVHVTPAPL